MRRASALLALVWACSSSPSRATQEDAGRASRAEPAASAAPAAPVSPASKAVPARRASVRALSGEVHGAGDAGLAVGRELGAGSELRLARGATLTLGLDDYLIAHASGPARLLILPEGEPAILLREGHLSIDCAPRGVRSTESAFWLATPDLRLDVSESARFAVRASDGRATALAVASGAASLRVGARDPVLSVAGEVRCGAGPARPGPRELAAAEALLAGGQRCGERGGGELAAELAALLTGIENDLGRENALLRAHSLALADADAALAGRRELAELSRSLLIARERARAVRSSLEASLLVAASEAQRALLARARTLSPYRL